MTIAERQNSILALMKENSYLTIADICRHLHFSESTVRRDLKQLAHENLIRLTRGGCIRNDHPNQETPQAFRRTANQQAKRAIARRAAERVRDNQIILLDCSTTVMEMIPFLRQRKNLTIITNCLSMAALVAQQLECTLMCTGGKYSPPNDSFVGFAAESMLRSWFADAAFFSTHAIDSQNGPTDQGDELSRIKSVMLEQAREGILLADASKFGHTSSYRLDGAEKIAQIITSIDEQFEAPCWQPYRERMILV